MGKTNLIAHWNRCLDLLQEEEYFCLFSDDDVMESRCVEAFYQSLETSLLFDVYHSISISLMNMVTLFVSVLIILKGFLLSIFFNSCILLK